jgi:Raf kinase inhibitor-like YbhB/YbcL family protein
MAMPVKRLKPGSNTLTVATLIALAGCGAAPDNQSQGGPIVDNATLAKLDLTSTVFQNGQAIPAQYSCDGADQPPPLAWGEPPAGTKSFALVVDDPDAPNSTFRHWGAYNIPASARSLAGSFDEAVNDFGKPGYGGPCPPKGHGPHHYHFKLFALDADRLDLAAGAKVVEVEEQAERHALGRAELIGLYARR